MYDSCTKTQRSSNNHNFEHPNWAPADLTRKSSKDSIRLLHGWSALLGLEISHIGVHGRLTKQTIGLPRSDDTGGKAVRLHLETKLT